VTWDVVKEQRKREICEVLTRIGALRFGTFELSGGRLSPYYIDLRIALSFPDSTNPSSTPEKKRRGMAEVAESRGYCIQAMPYSSWTTSSRGALTSSPPRKRL
jgi:orotate phosphoribosyltransferase